MQQNDDRTGEINSDAREKGRGKWWRSSPTAPVSSRISGDEEGVPRGASFGSLGAKEREIREGEKQGDKEEKAGREGAGLEELGAADGELAARWSGPGGAALDPPWIKAQEEERRRGWIDLAGFLDRASGCGRWGTRGLGRGE